MFINWLEGVKLIGMSNGEAYGILNEQLDVLTDIKSVYHQFETLEKREFIDLVFDSNLYYENDIYRTPTDKKREDFTILPSSALVGIRTPNLLIRSEMLYPIELQMHFRLLTDCKGKI